jgi:hypothetical protein
MHSSSDGGRHFSKKDARGGPDSKLKTSAKKKKTASRIAKLNSSNWYEGATRSVAISNHPSKDTQPTPGRSHELRGRRPF